MNKHLAERCPRSREEESDDEEDTEENEDAEGTMPLNGKRVNIMTLCKMCNRKECSCGSRKASENVSEPRPRRAVANYGRNEISAKRARIQRDFSASDQDTDVEGTSSSSTTAQGSSKRPKFCTNPECGQTNHGHHWRHDNEGRILCNACGLHFKKYKTHRPKHLIDKGFKRRNRNGGNGENSRPNGSDPQLHSERPMTRAMKRNAESQKSEVPAPGGSGVQMEVQVSVMKEDQHDDRMEEAEAMEADNMEAKDMEADDMELENMEAVHMEANLDFPDEIQPMEGQEEADLGAVYDNLVIHNEDEEILDLADLDGPHVDYKALRAAAQKTSRLPISKSSLLKQKEEEFFQIFKRIRAEVPGTGEHGTEAEDHLERAFAWRRNWNAEVFRELQKDTGLAPEEIEKWRLEREQREWSDPPVYPKKEKAKDIYLFRKVWLLFGGDIGKDMFETIAKWIGCDQKRVDDLVNTPGHLYDLLLL